jgi:hypothetical protein
MRLGGLSFLVAFNYYGLVAVHHWLFNTIALFRYRTASIRCLHSLAKKTSTLISLVIFPSVLTPRYNTSAGKSGSRKPGWIFILFIFRALSMIKHQPGFRTRKQYTVCGLDFIVREREDPGRTRRSYTHHQSDNYGTLMSCDIAKPAKT